MDCKFVVLTRKNSEKFFYGRIFFVLFPRMAVYHVLFKLKQLFKSRSYRTNIATLGPYITT